MVQAKTKTRRCNRGYNCGRSCISRSFNCFSNHDKNGKKIVENFTQQLVRLSGQVPFERGQEEKPPTSTVEIPEPTIEELIKTIGDIETPEEGIRPLTDKFVPHEVLIHEGSQIAGEFIDEEIVRRFSDDQKRKAFMKERSDKRQKLLFEREGLKIRLDVALIKEDFKEADEVTKRLDEIKEEMVELDPETRTVFFDRKEELLNEKRALRLKFDRGAIEQNELVKRTLQIDQELIGETMSRKPSTKAFRKLRDKLMENDNITREKVNENVEFVKFGISDARMRVLSDSLVEAAKLTNTLPREGFRVFKDPTKSRAYANHGFTEGDLWDLRDIVSERGINTQQGILNVSSEYYRSNKRITPSLNVGVDYFSDEGTTYHEFGHHVEFANRDLAQAMFDWVKSRASGPSKKLNELSPGNGYRDSEKAIPDEFVNTYVGKDYGADGSGIPQTEVFSMGLEYFEDEYRMEQLFSKDPEHFYLILGVLKQLRGEL